MYLRFVTRHVSSPRLSLSVVLFLCCTCCSCLEPRCCVCGVSSLCCCCCHRYFDILSGHRIGTIFLLFICARLPHVGLSFHPILVPPLWSTPQYVSPPYPYLHMSIVRISTHVFHTCYLHVYFLLTYYMPCKHGLFVYKLSVDLAISLASL